MKQSFCPLSLFVWSGHTLFRVGEGGGGWGAVLHTGFGRDGGKVSLGGSVVSLRGCLRGSVFEAAFEAADSVILLRTSLFIPSPNTALPYGHTPLRTW